MRTKKVKIVLCVVAQFEVCMIMRTDGTTKLSEEVCIILFDKKTGIPCMGDDRRCLTLRKKEILETKELFHQLQEYDLPFSIDDLKDALTKAQEALLDADKVLESFDNPSIPEIYKTVIEGAFQNIEEKDEEGIPYILNKKNALWIRRKMLKRLIKRAGSDKSATAFAKDLILMGAVMEKEILSRNSPKRYDSSTTINEESIRFFRINLIPELLKGVKKA